MSGMCVFVVTLMHSTTHQSQLVNGNLLSSCRLLHAKRLQQH